MLTKISHKLASLLPAHLIDVFGPDGMLFSSIPYYTLTFVIIIGLSIYDHTKNPFILLLIIYGIFPIVDEILTLDTRNPTP